MPDFISSVNIAVGLLRQFEAELCRAYTSWYLRVPENSDNLLLTFRWRRTEIPDVHTQENVIRMILEYRHLPVECKVIPGDHMSIVVTAKHTPVDDAQVVLKNRKRRRI